MKKSMILAAAAAVVLASCAKIESPRYAYEDELIPVDLDLIGYLAPHAKINFIRDGILTEKRDATLPKTLTNVIKCKNPRCITNGEQELDQIFRLTDPEQRIYRCIYCETKAN